MNNLAAEVQRQINDAPALSGAGFRKVGLTVVRLPTGEYDWNETIPVPADKPIKLVGNGTTLHNATGNDHIIDADSALNVGHRFIMEQVDSVGGSVLVGRRRGKTEFRCMKFVDTATPAIDFDGDSNNLGAVNVMIDQVETAHCHSAINFQIRTHALITIKESRFIASEQSPLYLDCIGSVIDNCDFTGCDGHAFVYYGGSTERSSHHDVTRCRFGNEDVGDIKTADYDIALGPSSKPGAVFRFRDNEHMGRENTTKAGALAAFKFDHRALQVQITGSYFTNKYQNFLVEETETRGASGNIWRDNIEQRNTPTRFSQGGVGWDIN